MYFIMISQQNCNLQRAMSYLLRARLPSSAVLFTLSAPLLSSVGLSAPSLAGLAPMPLAPREEFAIGTKDLRLTQSGVRFLEPTRVIGTIPSPFFFQSPPWILFNVT